MLKKNQGGNQMKTAVYCRVSTRDKQDINMQIDYLNKYAQRENMEIYKIYNDVGHSGSKDSRPEFDVMLEDLRQKKFNAILVYKLDRIGRSLSHLVKIFEEFKRKNVAFVSATQAINTSTPEGRMFLNMLMVLAEFERELTVSRINDGLARAKRNGKILGRPKGRKDRKVRSKSGYYLRWQKIKAATSPTLMGG